MPRPAKQPADEFPSKTSGIRKNRATVGSNLPTSSEDIYRLGHAVIVMEGGARDLDYKAVEKVAIAAAAFMADEELWAEEIRKPVWKRVLRGKRPKITDRARALRFLMRLHRNGDAKAASIRTLAVEFLLEGGIPAHCIADELKAWGGYEKIEQARKSNYSQTASDEIVASMDEPDNSSSAPDVSAFEGNEEFGVGESGGHDKQVPADLIKHAASKPGDSSRSEKRQRHVDLPFNIASSLVVELPAHLLPYLRDILSSEGNSFLLKVVNRGKDELGWSTVEATTVAPQ